MKVNYNGLWKSLIDKNMNKKDLQEKVGIASATIAKMGKGDFVSMEILHRICCELHFKLEDICEFNLEERNNELG